ncbi:hypothetical protein MJ699_12200 [Klebsiella pneumoniae]|nr:hypothetical protein MJ699_12200 [Klebsiella pneumoniae]
MHSKTPGHPEVGYTAGAWKPPPVRWAVVR